MPISTDVRKYGETALEQGKLALDEARKPWYAAVGATDLAFDQLREQFKELPTEAQGRLRRLQSGAGQVDAAQLRDAVGTATTQARDAVGIATTQARDAVGTATTQARDVVGTATTQAREVYEAYLTQARETYEALAHRGELVVRRLRRSPEVRSAFDRTEDLLSDAETTVQKSEQKVTRPGRITTRTPAARKAPAKRTAAKG